MGRLIKLSILVLTVISLLVSCGKKPYGHLEIVVPLGDDFEKSETEDFDVSYSNGECVVGIIRMSFAACIEAGISEAMTPKDFGAYWLTRVGRDEAPVLVDESTPYATYYDSEGMSEVFYMATFYRSPYAYFVVLYSCMAQDRERLRSVFLDYAENTYFDID